MVSTDFVFGTVFFGTGMQKKKKNLKGITLCEKRVNVQTSDDNLYRIKSRNRK